MNTHNLRLAISRDSATKEFIDEAQFQDQQDVLNMVEQLKKEIDYTLDSIPAYLQILQKEIQSNHQDGVWMVLYQRDADDIVQCVTSYGYGAFKVKLMLQPDGLLLVELTLFEDHWKANRWTKLDGDMEQRCEVASVVARHIEQYLIAHEERKMVVVVVTPDFNTKAGVNAEGEALSNDDIMALAREHSECTHHLNGFRSHLRGMLQL